MVESSRGLNDVGAWNLQAPSSFLDAQRRAAQVAIMSSPARPLPDPDVADDLSTADGGTDVGVTRPELEHAALGLVIRTAPFERPIEVQYLCATGLAAIHTPAGLTQSGPRYRFDPRRVLRPQQGRRHVHSKEHSSGHAHGIRGDGSSYGRGAAEVADRNSRLGRNHRGRSSSRPTHPDLR